MTILGGMKLYLGIFLMKMLCIFTFSFILFFGFMSFFLIKGMLRKNVK